MVSAPINRNGVEKVDGDFRSSRRRGGVLRGRRGGGGASIGHGPRREYDIRYRACLGLHRCGIRGHKLEHIRPQPDATTRGQTQKVPVLLLGMTGRWSHIPFAERGRSLRRL